MAYLIYLDIRPLRGRKSRRYIRRISILRRPFCMDIGQYVYHKSAQLNRCRCNCMPNSPTIYSHVQTEEIYELIKKMDIFRLALYLKYGFSGH